MARPKKYDSIINEVMNEIEATEKKLRELYEKRDEIEKEKEMQAVESLYKAMKTSGMTVEQMLAKFQPQKRSYNRKPREENAQVNA